MSSIMYELYCCVDHPVVSISHGQQVVTPILEQPESGISRLEICLES